jgi:hypothetical protein
VLKILSSSAALKKLSCLVPSTKNRSLLDTLSIIALSYNNPTQPTLQCVLRVAMHTICGFMCTCMCCCKNKPPSTSKLGGDLEQGMHKGMGGRLGCCGYYYSCQAAGCELPMTSSFFSMRCTTTTNSGIVVPAQSLSQP